ncbi:MAG: carbon-phosphorus lyase, partial [Pseudomonadota bacterium]
VIVDDKGGRLFCCSDTDYCARRRAAGHRGPAFPGSDVAA